MQCNLRGGRPSSRFVPYSKRRDVRASRGAFTIPLRSAALPARPPRRRGLSDKNDRRLAAEVRVGLSHDRESAPP